MAWRVINYGTAENDDGVRVERSGFRALKYVRANRRLTIDVEAGINDLGIYALSIDHWDEDGGLITEQERAIILDDVMDALRALRVPFEVLWD
jgi:hypothetical protein